MRTKQIVFVPTVVFAVLALLASPLVPGALAAAVEPAAPACGRSIVYSVALEGTVTSYDLYAIAPHGEDPATELYTSPTGDLDAEWSPDGRRLAFATRGEDATAPRHIWVMRPGRSEPRQLTTFSEGNNRYPSWSPDGSQLVYTTGVDLAGPTRMRVTNADGTGDHQILAIEGAILASTKWSPDGSRIVFTIYRDEFTVADIGMVDADGSDFEQLTDDGRTSYPAWASDESLIFTRAPEVGRGTDLFLADDQLQDPQQITHLRGHSESPEVSPSGGRVVFDNWGRTFDQLRIARLGHPGSRALTEEPGSYAYPAWGSKARC